MSTGDDPPIVSGWFKVSTLVFAVILLATAVLFYNPVPFTEYTVSIHGDSVPSNKMSAENTLFEENQSAYQKKIIQESLGDEYTVTPSEEKEDDLQELDNMSYVISGDVGYEISVSKRHGQSISTLTIFSFFGGLFLLIMAGPFFVKQLFLKLKPYILKN